MINNYYEKSDMVIANDSKLSVSNPELTKEIMNGVTDCASMINAIENYNDTNKLGYGHRINYAISTGTTYISVLKAYPLGGSHMCVIGWDSNGKTASTFRNPDNRQIDMSNSLSTHVIPNDKIHDVVIGSYDKDQLTDILENFNTTDEISEVKLFSILDNLFVAMGDQLATGNYRGMIENFTYTVKTNNLNDLSYEHKLKAYNKYVDCYVRYILALKDIVVEFNEFKNTSSNDMPSFKKKNLFNFIETKNDIDALIRSKHENEYGKPSYDNQYESWKYDLLQHTFTYDEVETFKGLIDYEHMTFDNEGMPIWKN